MNGGISQTSWYKQDAWVLENDIIRTVMVPDMGAKLVSLFDKRSQREWLVGPGSRSFQKVSYGAIFVDQDMSGWDEMFPTIVACKYPAGGEKFGIELPDHGEVWPLSWSKELAAPGSLKFSVEGVALRYRLTRTLAFNAPDRLQMTYELQNLEREKMPYIWAAHPQFVCGEKSKIVLPLEVEAVCNALPKEWHWGSPEMQYNWPESLDIHGQRVRIDYIGPASLKKARKFFVLPETPIEWAGLIRLPNKDWLRMEWDSESLPYLGLWIDEGALSPESVLAIEPMTGFFDSLETAWEKNRVAMIAPEEVKTWTMFVRFGTGDVPFPMTN